MRLYSNSRLWLFENCPEAYKIKYIDKKFPDIPGSINLFLGSMVHESLEWLYRKVKDGGEVELDDLITYYVTDWHKNYSSKIRINGNGKSEDFFNKGVKFLVDYYQKNKPFLENTVDIEKRILFPLDGEIAIQGYVDRIVLSPEGEYEVHDYKTNAYMKRQKDVDEDRQLAFYHLGLQELFGRDVKVKLIWHFLAHNQVIVSRRTQEQLDRLKEETLELIKKIESNTVWSACGKGFCDWCDYKKKNGIQNVSNSLLSDFV